MVSCDINIIKANLRLDQPEKNVELLLT